MLGSVDPTAKAKTDLAGRLNISEDEIKTVSVTFGSWSDGSLGCPEPGYCYTMALVPGSIIILEAQGKQYQYNASSGGQIKRKDKISQQGFHVGASSKHAM